MKIAWRRWITPLIVMSYVVISNLALASQSALWASVGVALFFLILIQISTRPAWQWARIVVAAVGIVVTLGVARAELPPVPLMLPPVVVPAAFAWLFGHTLRGDRVALVERFARAVHAPEPLDAAHAAYARAVTVMWTWALAIMALINLFLVTSLSPGGLLDQFGQEPLWPIDLHTYLWLSNGVYIVTPVIFVAEFLFRLRRFPDYRLSNPLEFARRARARLPAVIEQVRRG
jgi:uncharacterized membrane protein